MEFLQEIVNTFWFTAAVRILLGFLLCGIIGLEREAWSKPAGFRTHSLLGVCAVLVVLCGEYIALSGNADSSRIPAQLISGIGFIGAGTILRDGFNIKGLTTASTLLCVTCVGLTVGSGFYTAAIIATLVIFFILKFSHVISDNIVSFNIIKLSIQAKEIGEAIIEIREIFNIHDVIIRQIKYDDIDEEYKELKIMGRYREEININSLISDIAALERTKSVTQD